MRIATLASIILAGGASIVSAQQQTWSGSIGIGSFAMPTYMGSNQYRVVAAPILELHYKGRVYVGGSAGSATGGIGVNVIQNETFSWSSELGGSAVRRESRGDGLAGMGKRDAGSFLTNSVSYNLGFLSTRASAAIGLGDDEGSHGMVSAEAKHRFGQRFIGALSGGASFADGNNMKYDFGITSLQATKRQELITAGDSRLSPSDAGAYTPKGGLKESHIGAMLGYMMTQRTTALFVVRGARLGNEAAESPLTRQRNSVTAGVGVMYGF